MRLQCQVFIQPESSKGKITPLHGCVQIGISAPKTYSRIMQIQRMPTTKSKENQPKIVVITVSTKKDKIAKEFRLSDGNVSKVVSRFAKQGKATLLFKQPNEYVFISKADPSELSLFLKQVKAAISGQNLSDFEVVKAAETKDLEPKATRLVVNQSGQYRSSEFPVSLERLEISGFPLSKVDPRWNKLNRLTVLTLAGLSLGRVSSLWSQLTFSHFPNLLVLNLSLNSLPSFPAHIFTSLSSSLNQLDLSSNLLTQLPDVLGRLTQLRVLRLNHNRLKSLPSSIGDLESLNTLRLENNTLSCLPGAFCRLRINQLDLTANSNILYSASTGGACLAQRYMTHTVVPSLFERAAATVIQSKLPQSLLPWDVSLQLCHEFEWCAVCLGPTCPSTKQTAVTPFDMQRISSEVATVNGAGRRARIRAVCCSDKCRSNFLGQ